VAAIPFVRRERGRGEGAGPQPTTSNAKLVFFLSLSLSQGHTIRVGKTILERKGEE
jgi:hypothetical protein